MEVVCPAAREIAPPIRAPTAKPESRGHFFLMARPTMMGVTRWGLTRASDKISPDRYGLFTCATTHALIRLVSTKGVIWPMKTAMKVTGQARASVVIRRALCVSALVTILAKKKVLIESPEYRMNTHNAKAAGGVRNDSGRTKTAVNIGYGYIQSPNVELGVSCIAIPERIA